MLRYGLFKGNRNEDSDLEDFLKNEINSSNRRLNTSQKTDLLLEIHNRIYNDNIDFKAFCSNRNHEGAILLVKRLQIIIKCSM